MANPYHKLRHDLRATMNLMTQLKQFLGEKNADEEMKSLFQEALTKQIKCLEEQYNQVVLLENQTRAEK